MDKTQKDGRSRFAMFAELHSPKLKEWGLIKENLADEMFKFYKKLCQMAHPQFESAINIK
jgi:hypothetical protein